jgi:hypothetical protein
MKEAYEKPDVESEEIFERTALSCVGINYSLSPTGEKIPYISSSPSDKSTKNFS